MSTVRGEHKHALIGIELCSRRGKILVTPKTSERVKIEIGAIKV